MSGVQSGEKRRPGAGSPTSSSGTGRHAGGRARSTPFVQPAGDVRLYSKQAGVGRDVEGSYPRRPVDTITNKPEQAEANRPEAEFTASLRSADHPAEVRAHRKPPIRQRGTSNTTPHLEKCAAVPVRVNVVPPFVPRQPD